MTSANLRVIKVNNDFLAANFPPNLWSPYQDLTLDSAIANATRSVLDASGIKHLPSNANRDKQDILSAEEIADINDAIHPTKPGIIKQSLSAARSAISAIKAISTKISNIFRQPEIDSTSTTKIAQHSIMPTIGGNGSELDSVSKPDYPENFAANLKYLRAIITDDQTYNWKAMSQQKMTVPTGIAELKAIFKQNRANNKKTYDLVISALQTRIVNGHNPNTKPIYEAFLRRLNGTSEFNAEADMYLQNYKTKAIQDKTIETRWKKKI